MKEKLSENLSSKSLKLLRKKYEKQGVDIGRLMANLGLTPTQRLENNYHTLLLIDAIKKLEAVEAFRNIQKEQKKKMRKALFFKMSTL